MCVACWQVPRVRVCVQRIGTPKGPRWDDYSTVLCPSSETPHEKGAALQHRRAEDLVGAKFGLANCGPTHLHHVSAWDLRTEAICLGVALGAECRSLGPEASIRIENQIS